MKTPFPLRGYIEGYYGRLLTWPERQRIADTLFDCGMNSYLYAPKEDPCHRFRWRDSYSTQWLAEFSHFCDYAEAKGISVFAGIAPGLDFEFAGHGLDSDFSILCNKAEKLLASGAQQIVLLMDDIDADFTQRNPTLNSEGAAHANLANRLAEHLGHELLVVPRVYADEINTESPEYLPSFGDTLASEHAVFYCGERIVEQQVGSSSLALLRQHSQHQVVIWDNLYANDYCPRRLYLGAWQGRAGCQNVMLNPTGMVETDRLLLSLMHATGVNKHETDPHGTGLRDTRPESGWSQEMYTAHDIPECFAEILCWFDLPPFEFPLVVELPTVTTAQFDALETLLWQWKTPLSREWYPHLMGLKQDLLLLSGKLPHQRILKTQTPAIAQQLRPQH